MLVDFERSILERDAITAAGDGSAPGTRRRRVFRRLPARVRAWWKPPNTVAARQVDGLIARLGGRSTRVLVIGGGALGNGTEALYAAAPAVIGFDIYGSELTQFIADAHQIPLPDATVDAVVIQAVLEHVLDPGQVVREAHRVLRPGGLVYAETPFLQQVHAGPYDFTRYTAQRSPLAVQVLRGDRGGPGRGSRHADAVERRPPRPRALALGHGGQARARRLPLAAPARPAGGARVRGGRRVGLLLPRPAGRARADSARDPRVLRGRAAYPCRAR